ncbi:MAG: ATP-binding protein, partial [Bacteroidota bacterium]
TSGSLEYAGLPVVQGAQVLLYQLFYNLINNSIKFAKPDVPPRITLSSELITSDNTVVARIALSDNGIGFNQGYAEQIFETFTRLNPKDKYEGTGLGLALCKKIVERHNGTITAKSEDNSGATFSITLPLEQKEKDI